MREYAHCSTPDHSSTAMIVGDLGMGARSQGARRLGRTNAPPIVIESIAKSDVKDDIRFDLLVWQRVPIRVDGRQHSGRNRVPLLRDRLHALKVLHWNDLPATSLSQLEKRLSLFREIC